MALGKLEKAFFYNVSHRDVVADVAWLAENIFKKNSPAVLYGGSVDEKNVGMFRQIKEIDGFLIGGASKSFKKFIDIIKNYYR